MQKQIYQGAEAIILQDDCTVIKKRIKKSYRIPEIDEKLRKLRTRAESRIMERLAGKISVPRIVKVDEKNKEIIMQFIQGKKLSDYLDNFPIEKQLAIAETIGEEAGKMHDLNIIHSDLTTSNMILAENSKNEPTTKISEGVSDLINSNQIARSERARGAHDEGNSKIFFIDFGLSFHSTRIEDKAVDLHLLRQALESKHFENWQKLFKAVLSGYKTREKEKILLQLKKVDLRGRYK